ncbi:MAG: hypothetical protein QOF77_977 [Solirubrobacteraceae bacterium]|nr:hypothetical protein [Solirubrobacteraceae bacterium]
MRWLEEPEEKDYAAAESFLSLLVAATSLPAILAGLRAAPGADWAAKDVLRAAGLPALGPHESDEVKAKKDKIDAGEPLSPILLVGGVREYLVIADGYHRVSAAFGADEGTRVPGRLLWRT